MAASTYDAALKRVLAHEGGYTNHPADPGGPTNFGITIRDYAEFKGRPVTAADVRAMPLADAKAIYRAKYWARLRCDDLAAGLDYAVFDYGVNSGTGRVARVLARLLEIEPGDRIGDATVRAAATRDPRELIARLCDERLAFLKRLRTWPVFGAGWGRRVAEVKAAALEMAAMPALPVDRGPAAQPPDATAAGKGAVPLNTRAQGGTAGGVGAAGAAAAQQAHHAGAHPLIIIAIVAATVCLAVAGWWLWRWRQRRQQLA
jgi:lysozyme family protein